MWKYWYYIGNTVKPPSHVLLNNAHLYLPNIFQSPTLTYFYYFNTTNQTDWQINPPSNSLSNELKMCPGTIKAKGSGVRALPRHIYTPFEKLILVGRIPLVCLYVCIPDVFE